MFINKLPVLALAITVGFSLTACGGGDPLAADSGAKSAGDTITVGSANFPESELLGEIYAQALESAGVKVARKFNIGAREVYLAALADGSIDLLPEYNGALLTQLSGGPAPEGVNTSDEVYDALQDELPDGTVTLPQSSAEDKDTLAVTQETASKYGLASISDLEPVAGELSVGAGPGWDEIYQGLIGLKDVYGIEFDKFVPLDAGGPLTVGALTKGDIDVANIYSTDSAIKTENLVVLSDESSVFLSENIVPLIRETKLDDNVEEALNAVSEALTTEKLTDYLEKVQVEKQDSASVAKAFLTDEGLV